MGCTSTTRPDHGVISPDRKQNGGSPKANAGKREKDDSAAKLVLNPRNGDEKNLQREESKEVGTLADIAISPSQFVLEKAENICQNYAIKEKLGEGSSGGTKRYRIVWNRLQSCA
ncbi:MAG: hypothetical protein A2342_03740 [Gallionellales bacterium RIFOXYB12_FULL_54_9]|nr:MAG: hypothetical protein A2342_03740 [Gallionellales bacterium RIFOXYB12_FULL_54_9]